MKPSLIPYQTNKLKIFLEQFFKTKIPNNNMGESACAYKKNLHCNDKKKTHYKSDDVVDDQFPIKKKMSIKTIKCNSNVLCNHFLYKH